MNSYARYCSILLAIFLSALTTSAIIIRHDRDDAKYIALGAKYPAVGHLGESVECTLIAPRWAITAAHTVEGYFNPSSDPYVVFTGKRYVIEKMILHPARINGTVDSSADMALLKLAQPVEGITPVLLYDKDDEVGKIITIVGRGETGTGLTGPVGEKSLVPRGATNKIEAVFENSFILTFDEPPGGTELEGLSGPGDSGCPALLEQDGKLYTLGVGSYNGGGEDDKTCCKYRTLDAFARISTRRKWITDTMAADPPSTILMWNAIALKKVESEKAFPATPVGKTTAALLTAFNSGQKQSMAKFFVEFGNPYPNLTPEKIVEAWGKFIDRYGKYGIHGYKQAGLYELAAIVYSTREKIWRVVYVRLDKSKPHKLARISMRDISPPKDVTPSR